MEYEDLISIATPEGVALTLTLAGLGSRGVATLLDWCVRLPILIVAAIPAAHSDAGRIVFILVAFVMVYVYDVLFEAFGGGRTPGKRWTSLRVLHADGRPESAGAAAVRNVVRIVDWLPSFYLVGGASIVATARNQRLGDLAADTIVVREPRPPKLEPHNARRRRLRRRTTAVQPAPTQEQPEPTTPQWLPPWDVTAVTQQDLAAVRTFLERRPMLGPETRQQLAQRLAAGLAAKIPGADSAPPDPERMLETVAALRSARGRLARDGLPAWDVTAITDRDLAAVRTFLERRAVLEPGARRDLAQRLAAGVAAKIPGATMAGADTDDPELMLETVAALKAARGR